MKTAPRGAGWCRGGGIRTHMLSSGGFKVRCVFQFHHAPTGEAPRPTQLAGAFPYRPVRGRVASTPQDLVVDTHRKHILAKKAKQIQTSKDQIAAFRKAARELGCDE